MSTCVEYAGEEGRAKAVLGAALAKTTPSHCEERSDAAIEGLLHTQRPAPKYY